MQVRKLTGADLAAARDLGTEAFGGWPAGTTPPPLPPEPLPGRHPWGAFDGDRLVAKVQAHEYASWWHGVRVPTCGIAGVAVAAEYRGRGLLLALFEAVLAEAVERGEVISTLFPTAPGIYRSLGYELIGSYDTVELPTAELGRLTGSPPSSVTTRRAGSGDLPAIQEVYDTWAAEQNGPLTRSGPLFDPTALLDGLEVSLAVDALDRVVGFASWQREEGYGPQGRLRVHDLLALTGDGYRALWALAGSFASVTGTVRLSTSGDDPARLVLPGMTWDVVSRHPYMLRVLDLPAALALTSGATPGDVDETVRLDVRGDRLGLLDGGLAVTLGRGEVHPSDRQPSSGRLTVQGAALLFAGAQSCGNLHLLGHLDGVGAETRRALDSLVGGRPIHIRDYF